MLGRNCNTSNFMQVYSRFSTQKTCLVLISRPLCLSNSASPILALVTKQYTLQSNPLLLGKTYFIQVTTINWHQGGHYTIESYSKNRRYEDKYFIAKSWRHLSNSADLVNMDSTHKLLGFINILKSGLRQIGFVVQYIRALFFRT